MTFNKIFGNNVSPYMVKHHKQYKDLIPYTCGGLVYNSLRFFLYKKYSDLMKRNDIESIIIHELPNLLKARGIGKTSLQKIEMRIHKLFRDENEKRLS